MATSAGWGAGHDTAMEMARRAAAAGVRRWERRPHGAQGILGGECAAPRLTLSDLWTPGNGDILGRFVDSKTGQESGRVEGVGG